MIKRISKITILNQLKAKYLRGGLTEKNNLAEEAGSRGFSNLQIKKKLKEMGYNPARRKTIIKHIVGGREMEKGDLMKLNAVELKNKYNLSAREIKEIGGKKESRKIMNVILGRKSSGEVKGYVSNESSERAKKRILNIERGASAEENLGVGELSKAVGHFASSNKNIASNKTGADSKHVGVIGSQTAGVTNQLNNPNKISSGSTIKFSKVA